MMLSFVLLLNGNLGWKKSMLSNLVITYVDPNFGIDHL